MPALFRGTGAMVRVFRALGQPLPVWLRQRQRRRPRILCQGDGTMMGEP